MRKFKYTAFRVASVVEIRGVICLFLQWEYALVSASRIKEYSTRDNQLEAKCAINSYSL